MLINLSRFLKIAGVPGVINAILFQLATFNSVANPYLYFYFSINFKHELLDVLKAFGLIRSG